MWGWSERKRECADACAGDGLVMASASVARSTVVDCGEYPGVVAWAPSEAPHNSAAGRTERLIILVDFLILMEENFTRRAARARLRLLHAVLPRCPHLLECSPPAS